MKINPVHGNRFTQATFGRQQQALKSDIEGAKLSNTQSFGRQTNKSDDVSDLKSRNSQLQKQMLVQKALKEHALKSDVKNAGQSNACTFGKQLKENDDNAGAERRKEEDPQKKLAELRLKRIREEHDSMMQLAKIHAEMMAEKTKTAAQIQQLQAETSQAISDMQRKSYLQKMVSDLKAHKSYLQMLTETEKA